jgi:hypothetical protein
MNALGITDCNPLNLTYRPQDKWVGLASPPNNGRFCRFTDPKYAFRAYTIQLKHYLDAGINTVPKIIKAWSETDVAAYTADVLRWGHFGASQVLALDDALVLFKAQCRQEDGSDPYDDSIIQEGIAMATDTPSTTMTTIMNHPTTTKAITGGSVAVFLGVELAKFHLYDMSAGETVALGVVLSIVLHRLFPQGIQTE